MKEPKRDLEADLKILTAIPRDQSEPVNMVHDVVAPHALRRAIEAERQLTEKDATIKKLEDMSRRWEKAFTNADKQYLKKEKEAAELRRMIEGRDERLGIALDEAKRLRKALEEAKLSIRMIDEYGEDPWAVTKYCDMAIEEINAALGEGDNP